MAKYRVTIDLEEVRYASGMTQTETPNRAWRNEAVVEGDEKITAGALRAMADRIDPPNPKGACR